MDHTCILADLFIGSHPAGAADIELLKQNRGITAVLNLQTDDDMKFFKIDRSSLSAHYESCGIELRRMPVRDFDPDDLRAKLPACVALLDELIQAGHKVFLHCSAGVGRSPTVAIAYLSWRRGWRLERAVAHVKQSRLCSPNVKAIRSAGKAS